jgi:lysophospholipase L1-like esterase
MLQFGTISFDSILWFCASGKSFFLGLLLLAIGMILPSEKKWTKYPIYILRASGLLFVVLSSTPLHPLFYIFGLILLLGSSFRSKRQGSFKILFILFTLLIAFLEIPFHLLPHISTGNADCIYVIGDSISAGMGNKHEKTWPVLLSEELHITAINLSVAGATAESAMKQQVSKVLGKENLVFLEIGGNDLLNYNSPQEYKRALTEIIQHLQTSSNQIIWFELPLLPQYYSYGRIQRKLAGRYDITLIPKSVLANVFRTLGATSDGMHLTPKGHEMLALKIQKLIKKGEIE